MGDLVEMAQCVALHEEVRAWCEAYGDDPRLKIALCGLDGEHAMPGSCLTRTAWAAKKTVDARRKKP
jgi:hypothetical protein